MRGPLPSQRQITAVRWLASERRPLLSIRVRVTRFCPDPVRIGRLFCFALSRVSSELDSFFLFDSFQSTPTGSTC
jgi:hypothetical protein